MQWWRAKRRNGAWLALAALALQLALSFAHVHAEDILSDGPAAVTQPVAAGGAPGSGSDDHDGSPAHDACAICAVMHLAGALVLPTPPAVVVPAIAGSTPSLHHIELALAAPRHSPFRSRAPPIA